MTESAWLAGTAPTAMLDWLTNRDVVGGTSRVSERKMRLFAVAWWRSIEPHVEIDERNAQAAEKTGDRYTALLSDCESIYRLGIFNNALTAANGVAFLRAVVGNPFRPVRRELEPLPEFQQSVLDHLVHEHFGKPVTVGSTTFGASVLSEDVFRWNKGAIPAIAQDIYESRDFSRMGFLHDMLIDAGCDNMDVIEHCRGRQRCSECLGTGTYPKQYYTRDGDYEYDESAPCSPCDGQGFVPDGPVCLKCNGSGRIKERRPCALHASGHEGEFTCPDCGGTGHGPSVRVIGDWVIDLLTGQE